MRVLELPAGAGPRAWGHVHGESFRGEVRALSEIRTFLCTRVGGFADRAAVLAAARAHLPVLARYDDDLYQELCGIAEGAGISAEEVVVANHYTDLRDLPPDPAAWRAAPPGTGAPAGSPAAGAPGDEGCSVMWGATPTGRILAQTWDMHATAIPFMMMLRVPDGRDRAGGAGAWILTLTGCLGLAGLSSARVGVAINNLYSTDATVGAVWPAVVRRALAEPSAAAARDLILASPIGSGHHYFVADREDAFAIETSGVLRRVIYDERGERGDASRAGGARTRVGFCHTNHALDPEVAAVSKLSATTTTHDRMAWLERSLAAAPLRDLDDAWTRMGSQEGWPRSVCTNMSTPENPHGTATCGAIAMNLDSGEVWGQGGFVTNVRPEVFSVAREVRS